MIKKQKLWEKMFLNLQKQLGKYQDIKIFLKIPKTVKKISKFENNFENFKSKVKKCEVFNFLLKVSNNS